MKRTAEAELARIRAASRPGWRSEWVDAVTSGQSFLANGAPDPRAVADHVMACLDIAWLGRARAADLADLVAWIHETGRVEAVQAPECDVRGLARAYMSSAAWRASHGPIRVDEADLLDGSVGWCVACHATAEDIPGDARGLECAACGQEQVHGGDVLLHMGRLVLI